METERLLSFRERWGKILPGEAFESKGVKVVYGAFATKMDEDVVKKAEMEISIGRDASIEIKDAESGYLLMSWDKEYIFEPESAILLYVLSEKAEWLIYKSPALRHGFCLATATKTRPSMGEVTRLENRQHFKAYVKILELLKNKAFGNRQIVYGFSFEEADATNKF